MASDPPATHVSRAGSHRRPAGAVAAILVVTGMTTRQVADAKLREWTETQAVPTVARRRARTRGRAAASTCRAGWRPITARRSMRASAAT